ncbi:hypothetical protein [Actinoplanes derwentensis]|uniref:Low temperature requirement A protein (LtrA) n=1 Tax=Actinoplanes derwentensis TaxID=113562 RepID=A0A1H2AQ58_9ACTN|nr:hypothetical protein [Actinoplanes derwentensis]GID84394.1 hypothetical protein Ade03nite_33180 [Actinoplanes derwentensis]SDT48108.1 hypothetical protein SAMN04489716_4016 [Actinoplanes derwentensis]
MPSNSATVRHAAVDAPVLLLVYGLIRLFDGLNGSPSPGSLVWNVGHLAFFVGMVLFGLLSVTVRELVPPGTRPVATVAAASTIAGVACFLWMITGDLAPALHEISPLPAVLATAGPLLFALGLLTALGLLVAARQVPTWSPLLFGAGVAAVIIDLSFLPFAALIVLAALAPLARPHLPAAHSRPPRSRIAVG